MKDGLPTIHPRQRQGRGASLPQEQGRAESPIFGVVGVQGEEASLCKASSPWQLFRFLSGCTERNSPVRDRGVRAEQVRNSVQATIPL